MLRRALLLAPFAVAAAVPAATPKAYHCAARTPNIQIYRYDPR